MTDDSGFEVFYGFVMAVAILGGIGVALFASGVHAFSGAFLAVGFQISDVLRTRS
jgi:hypothetical protein